MTKIKKWTNEEIEFLKHNTDLTNKEIAKVLERSEYAIKMRFNLLGIKKTSIRHFTEKEIQTVKEMYPKTKSKEIAELLNVSTISVYKLANRLGLKKDADWLKKHNQQLGKNLIKNGHGSRFKKGHIPWCAGKKIGTKGNTGKTQFKKGAKPHNYEEVGTIKQVSGTPYFKIKIADPNKWEHIQRYIWKKEKGKIPKGYLVVFKDGNPANYNIKNLELITREELASRNTIMRYPKDLRLTMRAIGRLKKEINNCEK